MVPQITAVHRDAEAAAAAPHQHTHIAVSQRHSAMITDDGGGEDESSYRPQTAPTPSPLETITGVKPEPFTDISQLAEVEPWTKHVVSDVQGSKLKSLLNSLKR